MTADRPPPAHLLLEGARLAAVHSSGVLGREDLAGLDRLADYAAALFGRDMAAVSFVSEHHVWFGGISGLAAREVARSDSFCGEAIRRSDPLVVPDALGDPRFHAHELVQGPAGVRSYAGVPVDDGNGYRLGTVCVFGREPGSPAADGVQELAGLARLAGSFVEYLRSAGRAPAVAARVQGWLGVRTLSSSRYGRGTQPGLIVLSVAAGSPAAQAGLRPTDILHAIDQRSLRQPADVTAALAGRPADAVACVQFQRGGRWLECFIPVKPRASRTVRLREGFP